VEIRLNDDSGYIVALGQVGEKHYLRVEGFHNAQQVSIAPDAGLDVAQETADTLQRLNEIDDFNQFHGSWVYEITEWTAKKFRVPRDEMMEDA
jgi:hypothetical protein